MIAHLTSQEDPRCDNLDPLNFESHQTDHCNPWVICHHHNLKIQEHKKMQMKICLTPTHNWKPFQVSLNFAVVRLIFSILPIMFSEFWKWKIYALCKVCSLITTIYPIEAHCWINRKAFILPTCWVPFSKAESTHSNCHVIYLKVWTEGVIFPRFIRKGWLSGLPILCLYTAA